MILWVGTRIHGKEFSDEMLRERIPYMYVVPFHWFSNSLYRLFRDSCGLVLLEEHSLPHASPAQLKHRIGVFRKHGQG
ncbi:MAG: hypothetical protein ACRD2L_01975, partial [Terriglobia bacterium]